MSRFLKYLNIDEQEQTKLPKDIRDGGKLIDGMQMIYEDMPNGRKKDLFASFIAETALILIRAINKLNLSEETQKKVDEEVREMEDEVKEVKELPPTPPPTPPTPPMPPTPPTPPTQPEPPTPKTDGDSESKFLEHILKDIENLEF
jgi:hypothetical protein